jgi:hypothetical protein
MGETASEVSRVLDRTAAALQESARLAAVHAEREHRAGRVDVAWTEWLTAVRAAEASDRARLHAARFGAFAAHATGQTRQPQSVSCPSDDPLDPVEAGQPLA